MSATTQSYRMGQMDPETGIRPVNKIVKRTDGKVDFIQMEKESAPSLEAFREMWPTEPVEGAPRADELAVIASELTDEQLQELGLTRNAPVEEVPPPSMFASDEAEVKFFAAGLDADLLVPGAGNGADGLYNTADVRFLAAKMADGE